VEQTAVDYFFDKVVISEKIKIKKLKFSGYSDNYSSGLFTHVKCLTETENIFVENNGYKVTKDKLKIMVGEIDEDPNGQIYHLSVSQNLFLESGKSIVTISLVRKNQGISCFVIVLKNLVPVDWCATYAII
jgi:hypothetical protein